MKSNKKIIFTNAIVVFLFILCSNVICQEVCTKAPKDQLTTFCKACKKKQNIKIDVFFKPPYETQICPNCKAIIAVPFANFEKFNDQDKFTRGFDLAIGSKVNNLDLAYIKGMRFVYLKKSQGDKDTEYSDGSGFMNNCHLKWFIENWKIINTWRDNNKDKDFLIGAFHYWQLGTPGKTQAKEFLKDLKMYNIDLPPMLDIEGITEETKPKDLEKFNAEVLTFISEVESELNKRVILYLGGADDWSITKDVLYIDKLFTKQHLCAVRENSYLEVDDWHNIKKESQKVWQYELDKCCEFVTGDLDLYTFMGNEQQFIKYANETINP